MKLLIRKTHKYLSFFISIQLLLWTISGIYFSFNKIDPPEAGLNFRHFRHFRHLFGQLYFFTFIKGSKPTFNSEYDNGLYKFPICHGKERYKHPTQKPLALIKDLIEKHSNIGDVVLDTFAGTGTTGHACLDLDRKFILIEKDENYYKLILKRLNKTSTSSHKHSL